MSSIMSVFSMIGNYDARKVARDELENGLIVSTAYTNDYGYETAILNTAGTVYPVERYERALNEQVKAGHEKWAKFAEDGIGKTINYLGSQWDSLSENGSVVLT